MNKYNLQELLTQELEIEAAGEVFKIKFDGVQIPMIQRDYAQGRPEEKEIRDRFLNAIFTALENSTELELDFVYGSIKKYDQSKFFVPLDGQQRLTTLFLLYWYTGQREILDSLAMKDNQYALAKFSYDTRPTARKFCESLCNMGRIASSQLPSISIKDASWFYNAYEKDPTVKAMLNMLDEIHLLYERKQIAIYSNLSKLKFYILPLDGFGLSDELYIKMNARGKPLTDFENFKADLIKWMTDESNPEKDLFNQLSLYNGRELPYYLTISLKLDNEWANFFWGFTRNAKKEKDKLVDPLFLRSFNRLLLNIFILSTKMTQESLEKSNEFVFLYGQDKKDVPFKYSNFSFYEPLVGSHTIISRIERILDEITQHYGEISQMLSPSWSRSDDWRFFDPEISQTQRILFLAICNYVEHFDFDKKSFKEWIRVVWNIINNPDIRSVPAMVSSMKLVNTLSLKAGRIYEYLGSDLSLVLRISNNDNSELNEEHNKAKLILEDPEWESVLINGEAHGLFQGSIGFLLLNKPDLSLYNRQLANAEELFSKNGPQGKYADAHILMRATISKIRNFHELIRFKMEESGRNWSLLLRRNKTVRQIICTYCSQPNITEIDNAIESALAMPSEIAWDDPAAGTTKIRRVHEQLYRVAAFHVWMQACNAVDLTPRDEHYYIKKYRAWYDLVMLDSWRNELITELITHFHLQTESRCDQTDFYKGSAITIEKYIDGLTVSLEFDQWKTLSVGLRKDNKYIEAGSLPFAIGLEDKDWYYVKRYNYLEIASADQIKQLVDIIDHDIFDARYPHSLMAQLHTLSIEKAQYIS